MIVRRMVIAAISVSTLLSLTWVLAIPSGRADEKGEEHKKEEPKRKKDPMPKLPTGHELMKAKLKASHVILEGLALKDFEKIDEAGKELVKITNAAEFLNAYKSRSYELQMLTLRREASNMSKMAQDKNIDGATLAYMGITMTCVRCHQVTRDEPEAVKPSESGHATK